MANATAGPADSRAITRDYFDSLLLEQRLLDTAKPSTETVLFGRRFATPVMTAALSHLKAFYPDAEAPMEAMARGAALAGALHWIGMTDEKELRAVLAQGAPTVRVVKPYADRDKVLRQLREAKEAGALAVGMDIDHMLAADGTPDVVRGEAMALYSGRELEQVIAAAGLPFVVKGVLSVRDACRCRELGAAAIVVSHHNGRLPSAVPPLALLPAMRRALGADYPIFVDCGFSSGLDVYKAMALGASAVSVGAHLIPCVRQGGAGAVAARITAMTAELRGLMAQTGVRDTACFDASVLHRRDF